MVSSPSVATKLLFADQVHTMPPVAESATTKSYRCPLGYTTFTAPADGFFTVNVSVTSPLTVAESDAGSSLLGRTTTGGCGSESIGVVQPVSHGKLSTTIDISVPATVCALIAIVCAAAAVVVATWNGDGERVPENDTVCAASVHVPRGRR